MKCKKCNDGTMIEAGDHYVCLNCGARAYQSDAENLANKAPAANKNATQVNFANSEIVADDEQLVKQKKKKSLLREILDFVWPIILALVIALFLKTCIFANAVIPTGSMLNTIQENDQVLASRITYVFNEPERFDVIIFKYPDDESQYYVKRIIGMPGETVQIVNGVVYVTYKDGVTQQLRDDFVTKEQPRGDFGPYEVPEDSYFVLGDNRNNSLDSRYWTTTNYVSKDKIIGKVIFRYYPFNNMGEIE